MDIKQALVQIASGNDLSLADMQAVMGLCDRITVLNFGQKLTEGTPDEIKENQQVIEAYLGTRRDVTRR